MDRGIGLGSMTANLGIFSAFSIPGPFTGDDVTDNVCVIDRKKKEKVDKNSSLKR